ncbi:fibrillarin-like rRNA/tRNA 2'-O-methyltransferase [Candidatus Woesearchaeota archaeon]|nr:fibrillarin-like rRNA/tRNA 2'-O-methyltransferase [Candidatus Woesearchaeota archaeon]
MGSELNGEDVTSILMVAEGLKGLYSVREKEKKYLEELMQQTCPNLKAVAGTLTGAKLIAIAGSLKKLSEMPASTIQVLGAERALFRHKKTGAKAPKFGVIRTHQLVQVYAENRKLFTKGNDGYRYWDPRSSKLATAILKGMSCPIRKDSKVLYLGAAHGYTTSFVADIANQGLVAAIDFAPRVVRDLVFAAEKIKNMAPMLADANRPESYYHYVPAADIVYQDIAQKNQAEIFLKNTSLFLKKGGYGLVAIKARSIDTTKEPKKIYMQVRAELEKNIRIIDSRQLEPFQKDHCMFLCRKER